MLKTDCHKSAFVTRSRHLHTLILTYIFKALRQVESNLSINLRVAEHVCLIFYLHCISVPASLPWYSRGAYRHDLHLDVVVVAFTHGF